MTKFELIELMASEAGISKVAAGRALDAFMKGISNALVAGESTTLVGFGTFSVYNRSERPGRNPKTGEPLTIAASKTVKFKAGIPLKDALNKA